MVQYLYGEESYLINQFLIAEKHKIRDEINILETDKVDEEVLCFMKEYPFLESKKVCILRVATLKEIDVPAFRRYIEHPVETTDCYILANKHDGRLKVYKDLQKAKKVKEFPKLKTEKQLMEFITEILLRMNASISKEAMKELTRRLCYFTTDTNLYHVANIAEQLAVCESEISLENVRLLVSDCEKGNAFFLGKLVKEKNVVKLRKQVELLQREPGYEAIQVLSALLYQYRISYKLTINPNETEVGAKKSQASLYGLPVSVLAKGIHVLTEAVANIKKGVVKEDYALMNATQELIEMIK